MPPRDPRRVVDKPTWGNLRQGTIFSGAIADGYEGCEVFGIIITAQCDLVHGKTVLVNFLPVVHLEDWTRRDFASILGYRLHSELLGRLSDLLRAEGYSPTVLDVHDHRSVVETFFPDTVTGKSIRRAVKAYQALDALECLSRLRQLPLSRGQIHTLRAISPKAASNLEFACLRNSLGGYYFLSQIDFGGHQTGFVVLLRQIYHLPLGTALAVSRGIELDTSSLADINTTTLEPDSFAMPIGQLVSPYLEHFMQHFSTMFARIGIPDLPRDFQQHLAKG